MDNRVLKSGRVKPRARTQTLQSRLSERLADLNDSFDYGDANSAPPGAGVEHPNVVAARSLVARMAALGPRTDDDEGCVACSLLDAAEGAGSCEPAVPLADPAQLDTGDERMLFAPVMAQVHGARRTRRAMEYGLAGLTAVGTCAAVLSFATVFDLGGVTAAPHHPVPGAWSDMHRASAGASEEEAAGGPSWAWREAAVIRAMLATAADADRAPAVSHTGALAGRVDVADRHHAVGTEATPRLDVTLELILEPNDYIRARLPIAVNDPPGTEPLATIVIDGVPDDVELAGGERTGRSTWLVAPRRLKDTWLVLTGKVPGETRLTISAIDLHGRAVTEIGARVNFLRGPKGWMAASDAGRPAVASFVVRAALPKSLEPRQPPAAEIVTMATEPVSIEPARPPIVHHPVAKSVARPQSPVQNGGRRAAVADEPAPEVQPQRPARLTVARPDSPAAPERKARLIATSGTAPLPSVPALAPKRPAEPAQSRQNEVPAWATAGFSNR